SFLTLALAFLLALCDSLLGALVHLYVAGTNALDSLPDGAAVHFHHEVDRITMRAATEAVIVPIVIDLEAGRALIVERAARLVNVALAPQWHPRAGDDLHDADLGLDRIPVVASPVVAHSPSPTR